RRAPRARRPRAGLRLSRDDEPLQSSLHHLPAHLCGARASRRYELGAVHRHHRSAAGDRARGAARRRRAHAGQSAAENGALSQGPRRLRAVQHQRHRAQRAEWPRARPEADTPWSLWRRPWTVMYITANGRALPCCIAPFAQRGYENYTLGNATQQSLRETWNAAAYQSCREALLSDAPPTACANCGLRWSL